MTLAETQALFHEAIIGAAPVAPERLEACFVGTAALPAAERVSIYASMYRWRLIDALRETFPRLAGFLGEEVFEGLATDYLRRHPSEHHDVGQVGRRLSEFLREYPDPERPDLADLAALEWARHHVFFAASEVPIGPGALAGLGAEELQRAGLRLTTALMVLRLEHEVTPLWRRLEDGAPAGPPLAGPCAVAVWRRGFDVFHTALPGDEAAAAEIALAGGQLVDVCAAFGDREDAAARAHEALSSWFAEGWVVGVGPASWKAPADPLVGVSDSPMA